MEKREKGRSVEEMKLEYSEVNQNMRHYSNLRFTIFTVYFAVLTGVIIIAFGDNRVLPYAPKLARFFGLFLTLFFAYYHERASLVYQHFSSRGEALEKLLGYKQITSMPHPKFKLLRFRYVTWFFFLLLSFFWIYMILFNW
jgi:hypothetical protein